MMRPKKVMTVVDAPPVTEDMPFGDEFRMHSKLWNTTVARRTAEEAMDLFEALTRAKTESDRMDIACHYANMFYDFIRTFVDPYSAQMTAMYLRRKAAKELKAASRKREREGGIG